MLPDSIETLTCRSLPQTCCFSMRFVVMLDLVSTLILPATTVYLVSRLEILSLP